MIILVVAGALAGEAATAVLWIGMFSVPATFAATCLFVRWDGASLRSYGFEIDWRSCGRFALGLIAGLALVAAQTGLMALAGGVRWVRAPGPAPSIVLPLLGYLLLAVREELAFHGYPLRKLAADLNSGIALVVVALLFALEHRLGGASWENSLLGSGLGAVVFGMAALATKGLALPVGMHAAWNIGDWARGGKGAGGLWQMTVDPGAAVLPMESYDLVMALALFALWYWSKAQSHAS